MNIYRYKNYNFEGGFFPLGVEKKQPEILANSLNDEDYILLDRSTNQEYYNKVFELQYLDNIEEGKKLISLLSSSLYNLFVNQVVTEEQAERYTNESEKGLVYLSLGQFYSALNCFKLITPIAQIEPIHELAINKILERLQSKYTNLLNFNYDEQPV